MSSMMMQVRPSTSPMMFMTSVTFGRGRRLSMIARSDSSRLASALCAHHAAHVGRNDQQILVVMLPDVAEQDRRRVDVVHRHVEETLDLVRMQVHGEDPGHADRLEHVGDHLGADRDARRARAAILAGIAEIGHGGGDPARDARFSASAMTSTSIRLSFVGMQVDCSTNTILAPHVLENLDHHLAVGELADGGMSDGHVQALDHAVREQRIRVAREHHEVFVSHV